MGQKTETAGAPKSIFGLCLLHEVCVRVLPWLSRKFPAGPAVPRRPQPNPVPYPAGRLRWAPLDLWAASLQVRAGVGHGAVCPRTSRHLCPRGWHHRDLFSSYRGPGVSGGPQELVPPPHPSACWQPPICSGVGSWSWGGPGGMSWRESRTPSQWLGGSGAWGRASPQDWAVNTESAPWHLKEARLCLAHPLPPTPASFADLYQFQVAWRETGEG